jgi:transcriptional regulator with XRE-family HTH domain
MHLGFQIRAIREDKRLTQGDMERRTGLPRTYLSRVENGHTVPGIDTAERIAYGLQVPIYQLFYDARNPSALPDTGKRKRADYLARVRSEKEETLIMKFRQLLPRLKEPDQKFLLEVARLMVRRAGR